MTPNRWKQSFPKITELLPLPDTDLVCISVPREWIPLLWGYMGMLTKAYPYEGDDELVATNIDRAIRFLLRFDNCSMLKDIRIRFNRLEALYCDDTEWTLIGKISTVVSRPVGNAGLIEYDLNEDGIFEISQYVQSVQNIYGVGLPTADDNDKLCRAAWLLARPILDDWKDVVQLARAGGNAVRAGLEWFVSLIPYTAFNESAELIFGLINETTWDFLDSNVLDDETIHFTASTIFCALKQALADDDLQNFWNYVDFGPYQPLIDFDPINLGARLLNGNQLIELVYASLTGKNVAYLALSWAKAGSLVGLEGQGFFRPLDQILTRALGTAQYFDARDCGDFPCNTWSALMDFTVSPLSQYVEVSPEGPQAFPDYIASIGYQTVDFVDSGTTFRMFVFNIPVDPVSTVIECGANVFRQGLANPATLGVAKTSPPAWGNQGNIIEGAGEINPGNGDQLILRTGISVSASYIRVLIYIGADSERIGSVTLKSIYFRGTGENPFPDLPPVP